MPDDDPWRWKTPDTYDGCDGLTMALYFPGKYASHDAKVRYNDSSCEAQFKIPRYYVLICSLQFI